MQTVCQLGPVLQKQYEITIEHPLPGVISYCNDKQEKQVAVILQACCFNETRRLVIEQKNSDNSTVGLNLHLALIYINTATLKMKQVNSLMTYSSGVKFVHKILLF